MSPAAIGDDPRGTRRLSTVSIRVRVIAAVMAVLAVVLLALSFSVQSVFVAQSDRNLDALLSGRAQLARQLARSGVRPQQIVNRVGVDGVVAGLVLRDGTTFGSTVPTGSGVTTVTTTLPGSGRVGGAELTLSVNTTLAAGARTALRRILLVGGLAALVLSAALLAVAVRLALRPLDAMASLATDITAGARGSRLDPTRTDTEIGRTAQAFDAMLDELEGAETRARRAEEQTRAFLADAAHELRTPLAGVQAAAETLLQHRDRMSTDEQEHIEALLVGEARRAGRLVADLLSVARLDAGVAPEQALVELDDLAGAEVARARLVWPAVTFAVSGSAPAVTGDAQALAGVLRNLVDNAGRAVGTGGNVRLRLSGRAGGLDGTALVEVADDGPGVAPEDRERIFERLVRLDAARSTDSGGSGLGLAIARGTARAHGGDLVCGTGPDGGAVFRLELPVRAPSA